jgi:hypothetical protein
LLSVEMQRNTTGCKDCEMWTCIEQQRDVRRHINYVFEVVEHEQTVPTGQVSDEGRKRWLTASIL